MSPSAVCVRAWRTPLHEPRRASIPVTYAPRCNDAHRRHVGADEARAPRLNDCIHKHGIPSSKARLRTQCLVVDAPPAHRSHPCPPRRRVLIARDEHPRHIYAMPRLELRSHLRDAHGVRRERRKAIWEWAFLIFVFVVIFVSVFISCITGLCAPIPEVPVPYMDCYKWRDVATMFLAFNRGETERLP